MKRLFFLSLLAALLFAAAGVCRGADAPPTTPARSGAPLVLTLEESVATALRNSPSLEKAKAQVEQARGVLQETETGRNPSLTFNGSYTRIEPSLSFRVNDVLVPIVSANNWDANLTFQYLITDFGRLGKNEDAMRFSLRSSEEAYYATMNDLVFKVRQAFFTILSAQGLVTVAKEYVESAKANLKSANDRYDAGNVPRFDVYRAEATLESALQKLIAAENGVELAKKSYLELLDLDLNTPVELTYTLDEKLIPLDLEKGCAAALAGRPELAQLALMVEMGKSLVDAAKYTKNPQLLFTSVYDARNTTGFSQGLQWQSTFALAVPLYDRGASKAKVKQAAASLDQMVATYDDVRNKILLEVQRAYLVHRDACQRIEAARKQVAAAGEAKRIADLRYRNGFATIAEALDTQADYVSAQASYVMNLFEYGIACAGWEKATAIDVGRLRAKKDTETTKK